MRILLISVILVAVAAVAYGDPGDILDQWQVSGQSYNYVRGLAYDWNDEDVWCIDNDAGYAIDYCKFDGASPHDVVVPWDDVSSTCYWGFDIAYDGTYIYMNDQNILVYVIDPTDGSVVDSFSAPCGGGDYPEGIAYNQDTDYLYHTGFYSKTMWVTNTSGTVVDTWTNILPSASGNMGVAYGYGRIWVTNNTTNEIYRIDPDTGTLEVTFGHSIPDYELGLCWSPNDTLFAANFLTGYIYEIEPDLTFTSVQPVSLGYIKALMSE